MAEDEPSPKKAKLAEEGENAANDSAGDADGGVNGEEYVKITSDDAAWLLEDGSVRLQRLEQLAGATFSVEKSGQVSVKNEGPGGRVWAERCLHALCAMRAGRNLELPLQAPKEWEEDGWSPPLTVVDVPRDEATGYVMGKSGARLLQLSESLGVVTVLVKEAQVSEQDEEVEEAEEEESGVKVGDLMEAPYGNKGRWFEVEIVEVADGRVKAKWTYDEDQPMADLPVEDLRAKEGAAEKKIERPSKRAKTTGAQAIEVGAMVEAKFSNGRWFDARITKLGKGTAWVKWDYDETVPETEVDLDCIKGKPKLATDKFHIYGAERGRMTMELRILTLVEMKVPGFVSSKPKETSTFDGLAFSVVPLLNNGELKGKVIGKGGSVRIKIGKVCGSEVEYISNLAYIVGTLQERERTAAILDLLQTTKTGNIETVPEVLCDICSRMRIPAKASTTVIGKQRATLNQLEEEAGVITFWGPDAELDADAKKPGLEIKEGATVEGKFETKKGTRWFEAIVLAVTEDDSGAGKRKVKVRWTYDEDEESELLEADIRKPGGEEEEEKEEPDRNLLLFGPARMRKLVELRTMSVVEAQCPGTVDGKIKSEEGGDFEVTTLKLSEAAVKKCPEKHRKAIGAATNSIIEQIGNDIYFVGTASEIAAGEMCVRWLTAEKPSAPEVQDRADVEEIAIPAEKVENFKDWELENIQDDFRVFAFLDRPQTGSARVLVCGLDAAKRASAVAKLTELRENGPKNKPGGSDKSWAGGKAEKKKVVFVVNKEEEERRRKRAARFSSSA